MSVNLSMKNLESRKNILIISYFLAEKMQYGLILYFDGKSLLIINRSLTIN